MADARTRAGVSVTKSVVGLLYGIAHAQGAVGSLDRPLLDAFPEYAALGAEPARRKILVRHALTMTMGNYNQPENWRVPLAILNQFVLPALVGAPATLTAPY